MLKGLGAWGFKRLGVLEFGGLRVLVGFGC